MLKGKLAVGSIAFLLGAFSFGAFGSAANALTPMPAGIGKLAPVTEIAYYKKKKVVVYDKHGHHRWHKNKVWVYEPRYGHRYRYRRPGYAYYYGGYYYPRPFWEPGINLCIGC